MSVRLLGIVADDLTGAMDTSGATTARGLSAIVVTSPTVSVDSSASDALCVNTQTRNAPEPEAVDAVSRATRLIRRLGYQRLYKKIDSTMRGNVGPEVVTMMKHAESNLALVCPAFPAMGRTVRDGMLLVNGRPLTESSEGQDAFSSASSGSVARVLHESTGQSIGLVRVSEIERGHEFIANRVQSLAVRGHRIIVFDALTSAHLDSIAAVANQRFPDALMVGSAGLASAVATQVASDDEENSNRIESLRVTDGRFMLISGSVNPVTQGQIERVQAVSGFSLFAIDPTTILSRPSDAETEWARIQANANSAMTRGDDIGIYFAPHADAPGIDTPEETLLEHRRIIGGFIRTLANNLAASNQVAGLVLVGGDTSYSVLTGLHAETIELAGEIEPGIPFGAIVGGEADGRLVITKAGGFGDPDALVRIADQLRRRRG